VGAGGAGVEAERSRNDRELVRACAELASAPGVGDDGRPTTVGGGALRIADRLVDRCMRHVGASAATVILRGPSGRPWVASSSCRPARLLEASGAVCGEGPAADCLGRGEPVIAADLDRVTGRWSVYTAAARRHGFAAARGLPIRPPAALRAGTGARTIGVLSLLSDTAGPMATADLAVAQGFADLAAIAFATTGGRAARIDGAGGEPVPAPLVGLVDQVLVGQATGVLPPWPA
jgi:hypothetical protein